MKNEGKFKLAGDVSEKKSSDAKEVDLRKSLKRARSFSIISGTLLLATCSLLLYFIYHDIDQSAKVEQLSALKTELNQTKKSVSQYQLTLDSAEKEILELKLANEILSENYTSPLGVFFEVQLGGFNTFNLDAYNENLANLRQEKYDDKNQFLLGRFRSYQKAVAFERDLRKIGIKRSIIVGRIDDAIVTVKEALKAASEHNN